MVTSEEDFKLEEHHRLEEAKAKLKEMEKEYGGRIRNLGEIQQIRDMFTCIICQSLCLMRDPQFCDACQVGIFCKECIEHWTKTRKICPLCKSRTSNFKHVSEEKDLRKLLQMVQINCKNAQLYGCTYYGTFREIKAHENWCDVLFCYFCETQLTYQSLGEHRCYNMVKHFYLKDAKSKDAYYIKPSMVESSTLLEALKCHICKNILRRPQKCKSCSECFCEMCFEESSRYQSGLCPNKDCQQTHKMSSINRRV
jgi:hypothetical protein